MRSQKSLCKGAKYCPRAGPGDASSAGSIRDKMQPIAQSTSQSDGRDVTAGLSSLEARQRLSEAGPNEPVTSHRASSLAQILFLFINPLAIILLIASAISAAVGEVLNAA